MLDGKKCRDFGAWIFQKRGKCTLRYDPDQHTAHQTYIMPGNYDPAACAAAIVVTGRRDRRRCLRENVFPSFLPRLRMIIQILLF